MQTRAFSWLELCQSINQHDESSPEYFADNSTVARVILSHDDDVRTVQVRLHMTLPPRTIEEWTNLLTYHFE